MLKDPNAHEARPVVELGELEVMAQDLAGRIARHLTDLALDPVVSATGSSGGGEGHGDEDTAAGTAIVSKPKSETKTPPLYRVILMNDDYTPMEFVIHVLQKFFNKDMTEATQIMLQVHQRGSGVCGVFTYEIAETKVHQVNQYSRQNRYPLKCTMEKA